MLRTIRNQCISLIVFLGVFSLGAPISGVLTVQVTDATVKSESLPVYSSLDARQKKIPVPSLTRGTVVRIEWSVSNAQGAWCNISSKDGSPLGWVNCSGLDMPTTLTSPQTTQAPVVQQPSAASSPMQSNTGSQQFTAAQKNWALAASAVLTEFNRERHDTLAGVPLNETSKIHARQLLQEWWGIGNRDDLQRALVWIEQGGHRAQFSAIGERVSQMPPEDVKRAIAAVDVEDANSVLVAQRYYAKLGSQSITGWDYARYISLCRWGYASGYLSQEEAWDRIMDAARTVQGTFGSWRELGENYLIGRQFWSLHQTRKDGAAMRAAYTRLLNNPSSPWNRIPWNLDLR